MSNNENKGLLFLEADVKRVLTDATPWLNVKDNQDFFIQGVSEDIVPSGTRVDVKITGIYGDVDEKEVYLSFVPISHNNEAANDDNYEIPIRVGKTRTQIDEQFDLPYIISGTFCRMNNDGSIDILNDEEKKFKNTVENFLRGRDDEYAQLIRSANKKDLEDRELVLLHKLKTEIRHYDALKSEEVSPVDLIGAFVDITDTYARTVEAMDKTMSDYAAVLESRKDALKKKQPNIRKLDKETKLLENRIELLKQKSDYLLEVIQRVIVPVVA